MMFLKVFLGVLLALVVKDGIAWVAAKLDWRWSVNRSFAFSGVPKKVQIVRALSGVRPKHGEG